ncbi:ABC transporter substrate-binding protein [Neptuniibacter sp. QD72_48]|uniref:ABC transporter substrate-binding protein n=1 Tax=unclassified Neptuniibacter TaxID=2630693 RepID=UPI0039F48728
MRNIVSLIFWLLVTLGTAQTAVAATKIMLIHSYHQEMKWVEDLTAGVKQELGDEYQLSIHHMDTKRLPKGMFKYSAARAFIAFEEQKPDLVIICDDNGFGLLGEQIAKTTPVVFCGINSDIRRDYPWVLSAKNITGVVERPMIKRSIVEFARATRLKLRRVLILLGDSLTADAIYQYDLGGKSNFSIAKNIRADVVRVSSANAWKEQIKLSKKQGYDLILIAGYAAMHEENGEYVSFDDLSRWVSTNSPVMTITAHEQAIGKGKVMAGMVVSGILMGQDAANLAKQLLALPKGSAQIPMHFQSQGKMILSRHELRNWGLKIDNITSRSIILLP